MLRLIAPKAAARRDATRSARRNDRREHRRQRKNDRRDAREARIATRQDARTDRRANRQDGRNERTYIRNTEGDGLTFGDHAGAGLGILAEGLGQAAVGFAGGTAGVQATVKPDTQQWLLVGGGIAVAMVLAITLTR